MILRALRLGNVRRFANRGVAIEGIGDGVNVLSAPNEEGKSTCFDALNALVFVPYTSSAAAAKSLRPHSGGNPLVEAEFEFPDGTFRVAKRWLGAKRALIHDAGSGRLVAQGDDAEAWLSARLPGGPRGPAGLLWVAQGGAELGAADRGAREDALAAVAGEVEALTGGRRMVRALARCNEELAALVTATGRPRTGGDYASALDAARQHEQAAEALTARVAALRDTLARRRADRARLAALTDPEAMTRREAERAATAAALAAAAARADQLEAARAREGLAETQARAAAETRARAAQAARDRAEAARLAAAARAEAETAAAAEAAADTARAAATEAARAAEAALASARAQAARAEARARAEAAAARLAELETRLAAAEAARTRAETAQAEARALALPDKALDTVEDLERRLSTLEAAEAAQAMRFRIDYAPGAAGRVRRDGAALEDGGGGAALGETRLEIDGIGRLTLIPAPGAGAETAAALARVRETRDAALTRLGLPDLPALRARAAQAAALAQAAQVAAAEARASAPDGLDALRARIAALKAEARPPEAPQDAPAEAPDLPAAETRAAETRAAAAAASAAHAAARETAIRTAADASHAETGLARLDAAPAADPQALQDAETRAAEALAAARAAREALEDGAADLDAARAAADRAASVVAAATEEIATLRAAIAGHDAAIAARAEEEPEAALAETAGLAEAARARADRLAVEVAALTRLKSALETARAAARDHYFGPVIAELRPLLALLLEDTPGGGAGGGGAGGFDLRFDEASLLPAELERGGVAEPAAILSGGMREQLALLTRLAFARLLARGAQGAAPVILDDALVWSDDDRIERMFNALHRQARDLQILVLTCRQRAFERLGGRPLRMVDWTPPEL
ncbi:DNA repair exonuclease SbcCD ATPase subunit [Albimonas donghaensis]|uniref:DNA repair exonuclease SbcCD ATPase subunit n=1 Tax=Albimonas donghaensis TaxID=356660 RepID=A0A1H3ACW5_9RHOB|nr:hypothetical protein [Albimonas donghaensis]SDX27506.1 DNA repair exonuclease SbcCD ATPase subunit [Albimonas donghaensis]